MEFTDTQKNIYNLLYSKEKFQDEKGVFCIYLINDLAEDSGKSERTVQRVLKEFEEEKYILREQHYKLRTQKIYLLNHDIQSQSTTQDDSATIPINAIVSSVIAEQRNNNQMVCIQDNSTLSMEDTAREIFYDLPDSPASHMIFEVLTSGTKDIDTISERKKQVSNGTKYEVQALNNQRRISMENSRGTIKIIVELNDIYKMSRSSKKLFILSLIKANEQALSNGELIKNYISFPLQELVDIGFYTNIDSARHGFKQGMLALTNITIQGSIRKSRNSTIDIQTFQVPFIGGTINNGQCRIDFNPNIDWNFLAQYFTKLPRYYFKLSNKASDLLYYIFYIARQQTTKIADKGYCTISFRAIQSLLKLPSEIGNREPTRSIKQPIEDVIQEIEEAHGQQYGSCGLSLLPVYNEDGTILDFLNNGYLKVTLDGIFASNFIEQKQKKEQKRLQSQQHQKSIDEKVAAIKKVKAIEATINKS